MKSRVSVIQFGNNVAFGGQLSIAEAGWREVVAFIFRIKISGAVSVAWPDSLRSATQCSDLRRIVMLLPEIRLLQAAITLAEELNFSRAAERLHISQPTLSKQIVELESQLGFRLFERNHQIVDLTDAGRAFVEEAREAVLHVERYLCRFRLRAPWAVPDISELDIIALHGCGHMAVPPPGITRRRLSEEALRRRICTLL
jgi:DNA-binding MarR family transcriptional regulator